MRPEILSLVHRFLGHGLRLRSLLRLKREPNPKFLAQEHTRLVALLSSAHEAQQFADYAGDRPNQPIDPNDSTRYLGIRYALACWADEVVPQDAPDWVREWWIPDHHIETRLFDPCNDKSWKFWEQAGLAEGRPETDAVEGFYLCVMLGFRGDRSPEDLERWRESVEPRLCRALNQAFRPPPSNPAPKSYDPHLGQRTFQRAFTVAALLGGALFLFGVFVLLTSLDALKR